jgi:hypothetical protein
LDLVLEDRKITAKPPLPTIEEETKVSNGAKDKVNDKDAEDLKEHLAKLGEFKGKFDINAEQDSFTKVECITRFDLLMYRYKPAYMPQIKKAISQPKEFEKKWVCPDWKQVLTDKKVGLTVWQRVTEEGLNSIKAQAILPRSPQEIFRVIGDDKYRPIYDPIYETGYFLERIADQTFLIYHKTKKVIVVGPRDFVLIMHFNMTPEGTIYAIVTESGLGHLVPESKNIVRGYLPMGGWKFEPLKGDSSKTLCSYIAEIDLKGQMPGFMIKMGMKDQGYQVAKLGEAVEKYLKDTLGAKYKPPSTR